VTNPNSAGGPLIPNIETNHAMTTKHSTGIGGNSLNNAFGELNPLD
jgi:hypothetical protein